MWSFVEVVRTEESFGTWYALVTLSKDGTAESFYLNCGAAEPTPDQANAAGVNFASQKNLSEAPVANTDDSISQQEFFNRFTLAEVAAIYQAAQTNFTVMAYIKRMELSPRVHKDNPDLLSGLPMLETAQLIAQGRAAQILNW